MGGILSSAGPLLQPPYFCRYEHHEDDFIDERRDIEPDWDPKGLKMSKNQEIMLKRGFFYIFTCIALLLLVSSFVLQSGYGKAYQASMWSLSATVMGGALALNTRVPTKEPSRIAGSAGIIISTTACITMFYFIIGRGSPDADKTAMNLGIFVTFIGFLVSSLWTMLLWFPTLRESKPGNTDERIAPQFQGENYMVGSDLAGTQRRDDAMPNLAAVPTGSNTTSKTIFMLMSGFSLFLWWFFALICLMFMYDVTSSVTALTNFIPPDGDRVPPPSTKWKVNFTETGPEPIPTSSPTLIPTSTSPTFSLAPTNTLAPTLPGVTLTPTNLPTTSTPTTAAPTSSSPSTHPTQYPTTFKPTSSPTGTTAKPTTQQPSRSPSKTTSAPTGTAHPTVALTFTPTQSPVSPPPPTVAPTCSASDDVCLGPFHMVCKGNGYPTVMFEATIGETVWDYMWLIDYIGVEKNITKACAYSRAGFGYSHKDHNKNHLPRHATKMADELFAIVTQNQLAPIVHVAHGYSSFIVKSFHNKYYDIVSGLAYLDAFNPFCFSKYGQKCDSDDKIKNDVKTILDFKGLCPTGWPRARQILPDFYDPMGANPYVKYLQQGVQSVRYNSIVLAEFWESYAEEVEVLPQACEQGLRLGLSNKKGDCVDVHMLVVIAGNGTFSSSSDYSCGLNFTQETEVGKSTLKIIPDATHLGLIWKNESARLVGNELSLMVQRIRLDPPALVRSEHDKKNEGKKPCVASLPGGNNGNGNGNNGNGNNGNGNGKG
jgi:hypothetical protein